MEKKKIIRQVVGWILAAVIIYILFKTIYNNRDELSNWHWQINWINAVLAMIFLFIAYITASQAWRVLLHGFGHQVRLHEAFRVVYLANLGRYIPGKVWQVIGMVGLAREVNVPARVSLASFALVQAYALPASFLLVLILLWNSDALASLEVYRDIVYAFMAVVLVVFLILFFWPDGLNWALNKILRLFKQESIAYKPSFGNRISIFVWYMITWILFGLSFHFFLRALIAEPSLDIRFTAGVYIAAYNLGYIAIISPGGLGIREGVITALLASSLGEPIAASISLIHRVLVTIAEAVISLFALFTYKIKNH